MRRLVAILALTLLTAPALSGCIGGQDGEQAGPTGTSDPNDTGNDSRANESGGNASGNGSGNASGNGSGFGDGNESGFGDGNGSDGDTSASWTYDNRSGTVSSQAPVVLTGSEEEALDVENGTLELALNLSADGELDVCIMEPEAEGCTEEASTEDGNLSWNATDPASGEWTVELSHSGTLSDVDYELTIGQLIPAEIEGSSGNETSGNQSGNDTRFL